MERGRHEIRARDGRRLTVWVDGEGDDVLLCHSGTPEDGSTELHSSRTEAAAGHGLVCVGYSRPGYRYSDRHPGRLVADCAEDVRAIADALAIDSFLTIGWSGGGPHALACGALLPDTVRAVATVGSNAPRNAPALDWYAGMGEQNVEEFGAAEVGRRALQGHLEGEAAKWRSAEPDDVFVHFGSLLPDDAPQKMTREQLETVVGSMRNAVATGIWGWFDDDMAAVRDWGFDPADVEVPVAVWHGGEDDKFIPFTHGEWLTENIPGAKPHLRPAAAHLSAHDFGEILDSLIAEGEEAPR